MEISTENESAASPPKGNSLFDRALEKARVAEKDYRRVIGRSILSSVQYLWKTFSFLAKSFAASIFPSVQWGGLAWICLTTTSFLTIAIGFAIAVSIIVALISALISFFTVQTDSEVASEATTNADSGDGSEARVAKQSIQFGIAPVMKWIRGLRLRADVMQFYWIVWVGGSILLSYLLHRYIEQAGKNPFVTINEGWWKLVSTDIPQKFNAAQEWLRSEWQR